MRPVRAHGRRRGGHEANTESVGHGLKEVLDESDVLVLVLLLGDHLGDPGADRHHVGGEFEGHAEVVLYEGKAHRKVHAVAPRDEHLVALRLTGLAVGQIEQVVRVGLGAGDGLAHHVGVGSGTGAGEQVVVTLVFTGSGAENVAALDQDGIHIGLLRVLYVEARCFSFTTLQEKPCEIYFITVVPLSSDTSYERLCSQ